MKSLLVAACVAVSLGAVSVVAAAAVPANITAAVADKGRDADRDADARRHPAEVIAFSGVKAGDKVVDLIPGSGYFTKIFSKVVGPKGHVYMIWPDEEYLEAMRAGAVFGYRGLVREILGRIRAEQFPRKKVYVVATGGYAGLIAGRLPEIGVIRPHLTLEGLRIVANLND